MKRNIFWAVAAVGVALSGFFPTVVQAAWVSEDNLPQPFESAFTAESLVERGCEVQQPAFGRVSVPKGKPNYVRASDADETGGHLFCPANIALAGRVAGWNWGEFWDGVKQGAAAVNPFGLAEGKQVADAAADVARGEKPGEGGGVLGAAKDSLGGAIKTKVIWLITWLFALWASIGIYIIILGSLLMGALLSVGQFITSPFVRSLWPFVQGIANIGFILALLFIAASITLRLNVGGGVRRLLPRLLIAALLINFSLVIGGILVDSSRLLMAIEVRLLGGNIQTTVNQVGLKIVESSEIVRSTFQYNKGALFRLGVREDKVETQGWAYLFTAGIAAVLVWALAIGIFIITFMLFVRYVALLLLLSISPLAYLSFAVPKAERLGIAWWRNFLKYVFFGPVALAILILIPTVVGSGVLRLLQDGDGFAQAMNGAAGVAITVAMLVGAAKAGKMAGTYGANTIVDSTSKAGRRLAYGASGAPVARYVGRKTGQQVKDFGQSARKSITDKARAGDYGRFGRFVAGPKRKKDGTLERGQTSVGSRLGTFRKTEDRTARQGAEAVNRMQGDTRNVQLGTNQNFMRAQDLTNGQYVQGLNEQSLQDTIAAGGNAGGDRRTALTGGLVAAAPDLSRDQVNASVEATVQLARSDDADEKATGQKMLSRMASNMDMVDKMDNSLKGQVMEHGGDKAQEKLIDTMGKLQDRARRESEKK